MSNKKYFNGYYFKHQKDNQTVALIPGIADDGAFIQVITNDGSYNYKFPSISFGKDITIGNSIFNNTGIRINEDFIKGEILYSNLTPIKYDIMGPFKFFPMECRHGIISMHHTLTGGIEIEGKYYNFDGGTGYIEKDSGRSFPKKYIWIQCNDFNDKCSIMASVADIPFMGLSFLGCICAIVYKQKEYRLATYKRVSIKRCNEKELILQQGKYRLEIYVTGKKASPLFAPVQGKMKGVIHESNSSSARFKLYSNNEPIFDLYSDNVSYEYNM